MIEAVRQERIHGEYVTAAATKSTAARPSEILHVILLQALSILLPPASEPRGHPAGTGPAASTSPRPHLLGSAATFTAASVLSKEIQAAPTDQPDYFAVVINVDGPAVTLFCKTLGSAKFDETTLCK